MSGRQRVLLMVAGALLFLTSFSLLFTFLSTATVEQGQIVQHLSETRAALARGNAALEEAIARESAVQRLQERARSMGFVPSGEPIGLPLSLPITLPLGDTGP
ncbi:hypothetical protein [Thermoflexus sp.]|uniref:hypothetical protein n=1 Tax=Thermoflexus sp. TaxID=1969742 RepID=UPI0025EEACB5|nr:hypothetical protein [Thermoflexus sp.]MDW8179369.1 hypothetical protein [Anaerolineae bacterium]MCS6963706.1 hypothetical protein [Thermoflexus sp.]MCS7349922.1 hypothetical protein [Thermoflexus sp.]MCX7689680.1 hypothetical protein [Thermoflexus sp.]MDW8186068.1 hypothetical protein [Anaerolineae bacterium]